MDIKGKAAVVTGGSKGIGKAIAFSLARSGARVAIAARTAGDLERTARLIQSIGNDVHVFAGDMASEVDIRSFVDGTVQRFGGIDILVNNAGVGRFHPVFDFPTPEWDEMFNLNVRGLFMMTRESLPHLRRAGESVVVNVASVAGKNAFPHGAGYAATKHAVLGFSRCLMLEERDNGVRVMAICPGSVRTDFFEGHTGVSKERLDSMLLPEDVAQSVVDAIRMSQRAMVSEIDIRPTNPRK